jgi:hypothetical protein
MIVPRLMHRETRHNPNIAAFLRSLGFLNVEERLPWDRFAVGGIEVFTFPFYGEWSGPDSHFDGLTLGFSIGGRTLYTNVDAHANECGMMSSHYRRIRKSLGRIDHVLTAEDVNHFRQPQLWGGPFEYASDFRKTVPKEALDVDNAARLRELRTVFAEADLRFYGDFRFAFSGARRL